MEQDGWLVSYGSGFLGWRVGLVEGRAGEQDWGQGSPQWVEDREEGNDYRVWEIILIKSFEGKDQ